MNKRELIQKIRSLNDITAEEKAYLIELVNTKKKYGLVWEDKPEDVEEQLRSMLPVFKEVKERAIISEDENAPNHILIEGDNLHALTALTYTHEGKIDVIYIDPPYNTGNKDFIYNDAYVDKEDSYRHSKWLSFMDKRLRLAKKLLSEKGVIFISIDDYEQAQLKLLCDEILGSGNFVGNVVWQRSYSPINLKKTISQNHDFILIYCKQDFDKFELNKLPRTAEANSAYKNPDNDPRGPWQSDNFSVGPAVESKIYEITTPYGRKVLPPKGRCWLLTQERYEEFLKDNRIWFGSKGDGVPRIKRFLSEVKDGIVAMSLWPYSEVGHTQDGKKELKTILHEANNPFDTVKPVKLIDRVLRLSSNKSSVILDFFAGSGTTLHATMALNAEDGGNRQCILVTNNENKIAEEVTYERNKRVIQGYTNAKGKEVEGLVNNNLRYFKADFVPSQKTEKNRRLLTARSTDLLCIKEDCFLNHTKDFGLDKKQAQIFTNGLGKYMVVIYYTRNQEEIIEQLNDIIANLETEEKVRVYAFSPEKELIEDDLFKVADKIEAVPLPDSIYNAFRATFRTLKLDKKEAVGSNQEK